MKNKLPKFNPKKYVREKGRLFPITECLVADAYGSRGLTSLLIVRQQPSGKYMFSTLLIDRFCLGVKSSFCNCNFDELQIKDVKNRMSRVGNLVEVDAVYFHNLLYATIDFAEENGFTPDKEFQLVECVLEPDLIDDGIDEIPVGDNGKPVFINGPFDDVDAILKTLDKNVGEGNYEFTFIG